MVYKCEVGRFDGDYKIIAFNDGDSLKVVLDKAGMELHEGESVNSDDGAVVNTTSNAVDGETYSIVGNYKQGKPEEDVSTFNKEALADAIGDVKKERAEIEKEKAKTILREILDRKDVVEFNIKQSQEELKGIEKELKVFYKK